MISSSFPARPFALLFVSKIVLISTTPTVGKGLTDETGIVVEVSSYAFVAVAFICRGHADILVIFLLAYFQTMFLSSEVIPVSQATSIYKQLTLLSRFIIEVPTKIRSTWATNRFQITGVSLIFRFAFGQTLFLGFKVVFISTTSTVDKLFTFQG